MKTGKDFGDTLRLEIHDIGCLCADCRKRRAPTWTVIRNCCQGGPACSESQHLDGKLLRVVHATCVTESRAKEIAERWSAYRAVAVNKPWSVGRVVRPDAGAPLFAPVIIEDNEFVEHGITPSHDASVVQRSVDLLNQGTKI